MKEFLDNLRGAPKGKEFLKDNYGMYFEGWLLASRRKDDDSARSLLEHYREKKSLGGNAEFIDRVASDPTFNDYMYNQIVKKIEISGRFSD